MRTYPHPVLVSRINLKCKKKKTQKAPNKKSDLFLKKITTRSLFFKSLQFKHQAKSNGRLINWKIMK